MALIPESFLNAVITIGLDGDSEKEKHWIGTGFIVGRRESNNPQMSTFYIVTNKHIVQGRKYVYVRFNSLGDQFVKDYKLDLQNDSGDQLYSAHPNEKTDVIALQIAPSTLINDKSIWGAFDLVDQSLTLEEMESTGVQEGSFVYALGFPMNLVNPLKAPICRLGCISKISDAFLLKKHHPTYLVDAQSFPGNSGGPIISRPEYITISGTPNNTNANLIGILSHSILYRELLYSRQTENVRMIQEENSGLTIVHPVDRIKEVVELEWQRVENERKRNAE